MERALEAARRGIGLAAPNPAVGCVILDRAGQFAGEGWHEYERRDHAEVAALKAAGERARGGTAYVTLEPCNHTGRTGPCSRALVEAGVARVVVATRDPHATAAGGLETLRAAGIEIELGVGEAEARRLNEGFARWIVSRRPFVHAKVAMSLDGRIAPAEELRTANEVYWITGAEARAAVQQMRWAADAVLVGVGTVLADDPLLTDRSGGGRRRPLLRVVLDSQLRTPLNSKLVASAADDLLIFTVCGNEERIDALRRRGVRVEPLPAENGRVPLGDVLERLGEEQILTLLAEGGRALTTALVNGGHVDRLQLFVAPQLMGGGSLEAFGPLGHALDLTNCELEPCGADLSFSALLRDPWQL